jgi:hypothetical protein
LLHFKVTTTTTTTTTTNDDEAICDKNKIKMWKSKEMQNVENANKTTLGKMQNFVSSE